jgi:hypothetical protein
MQCQRDVYAVFTQRLRGVYANAKGLRNVYATFTQRLRNVYAKFTRKVFRQPMRVNVRKRRLRNVYATFTQGATC